MENENILQELITRVNNLENQTAKIQNNEIYSTRDKIIELLREQINDRVYLNVYLGNREEIEEIIKLVNSLTEKSIQKIPKISN